MGQYRNDNAHDPEMYAAAMSALFSDYPKHVIEYACDPRTGMASEYKFVPQVAEAHVFLENCMRRMSSDAKPATKLPPSKPLGSHITRPMSSANLFVRCDIPQYHAALRMHEETAGRFSRFGELKKDGTVRQGLWVPVDWGDQLKYAAHDQRTAEAQAAVTRAAMEEKTRQEREALAGVKSPVGDFGN